MKKLFILIRVFTILVMGMVIGWLANAQEFTQEEQIWMEVTMIEYGRLEAYQMDRANDCFKAIWTYNHIKCTIRNRNMNTNLYSY